MKNFDTEKKIAVLIDAENAQRAVLGAVLAELSKHGNIIVKRAYGDWASNHLRNWKSQLNELAIAPIQQFSYTVGKNSSDAAMIIDTMDLLYSGKFDAFALVTSDSDFTKLASRLKESQIFVFGVGEDKTPSSFRNACDDFILTSLLHSPDSDKSDPSETKTTTRQQTRAPRGRKPDAKLITIITNALNQYADEDGWALLATCGSLIKRQHPDFDPRVYGVPTLSKLVEAAGKFEIDRRKREGSPIPAIYIRESAK